MEKIGECVLTIGKYMVEPTINQARYVCCFNNIDKDLQGEETNLKLAKQRMEGRVQRARNNTEIIEEDVREWLSDSSKILEEVEGLRKEIEEKKSCLGGWCPNWFCRYWLGRKATKKTVIMKRLVENGKFDNVGHCAPLPDDAEFLAPKDFKFFQSSKFAFEQIIEALKNDQINLVGLHGMGGTGKTTLASAVGEKVKGKMFDKVIMVTITQTPNFKNIQAHIAEPLGLKLEEETEENRAKRLYSRFMGTDTQTDTETDKKPETEKILVILDDVWESFDLRTKIGISFEGDNMGCQVLLTTRLEQVCIDMNCQQRTLLEVLKEEEGLALLKKHAGIGDDSPLFNDVATQVAKECGGLPLALVAIGCSLKEKGINEWNVMSRKLKEAKLEDTHHPKVAGEKGIYATLKVSYDYLMGEKSKPCFLLCSLFPEDHAIPLEELLWYTMGRGWYQHAHSIEEARSELLSTVTYLKDSGLLLDAKVPSPLLYASAEHVKMHDMFRDVALWIASQGEGENVFMRKVGMAQIDWSKEKDWERYTAISLLANKIDELSVGLACPKLEILMLGGESSWKMLKVSDKFFEEMEGLKVLSLTYVDLSLKSLQFLKNLKTLMLVYCNTRDISDLKELNRLEILSFYGPPDELPREICELHNLRIVYLNKSVRIPSNVVGRRSQLEELYALDKFHDTGVEDTSMAGILEVISLPRLRTLHFSIYAKCLPKGLAFPKFQRYVICLNTRSYMESYKRALKISHVEAVSLIAFEALYKTLEYLRLEEVTGCVQNILPSIDRRFNELKEACISDCDMLQEVFQLEGLYRARKEVLPMLAKLKLEYLQRLRYIWKGPTQCVNFQSLTNLYINSCRSLEYIFPISIARDLVRLEELTIKNAPQVKQVFYVDHASEENIAEIDGKDIVLPKLRVITLETLESLTSFVPENYHSTCPNLEELYILKCSSLTKTFSCGERYVICVNTRYHEISSFGRSKKFSKYKRALEISNVEAVSLIAFEALYETLEYLRLEEVTGCVQNILPSIDRRFNELKEACISDCDMLQEVFQLEGLYHARKEVLPMLAKLKLRGLPRMRYIWKGPTQCVNFQSLTNLYINSCRSLEYIFPISIARDLVRLEELTIKNAPQVKQVFYVDHASEENIAEIDGKDIVLHKLRILTLDTLESLTSFVPENYHLTCPTLEELHILKCSRLTKTFSFGEKLQSLKIQRCPKLRHAFSCNLGRNLLLEKLSIEDCEEMEYIIAEDNEEDHVREKNIVEIDGKDIVLYKLRILTLHRLESLTSFVPENYHLTCPTLEELLITECSSLTTSFSCGKKLQSLKIQRCPKLSMPSPVILLETCCHWRSCLLKIVRKWSTLLLKIMKRIIPNLHCFQICKKLM